MKVEHNIACTYWPEVIIPPLALITWRLSMSYTHRFVPSVINYVPCDVFIIPPSCTVCDGFRRPEPPVSHDCSVPIRRRWVWTPRPLSQEHWVCSDSPRVFPSAYLPRRPHQDGARSTGRQRWLSERRLDGVFRCSVVAWVRCGESSRVLEPSPWPRATC